MKRARFALPLVLVLVGCSSPAPQVPEPVNPPTVQAPARQLTSEEWEAEGRRLAGAESWSEAAHAYEEAAKQRPLADLWNEASYAHMKAEEWNPARQTGERALKLNPEHPYALYNTGLALLNSNDACLAIDPLNHSARLQKDRWEPFIALGRAYIVAGLHERGARELEQASKLGAPARELGGLQEMAKRGPFPPSPGDLSWQGKVLLKDGDVTFYSKEEGCPGLKEQRVWIVQGEKVSLFVGSDSGVEGVQGVTLPGGQRAYWVQGSWVGAGISQTVEYYLLDLTGSEQRLFKFVSPLYTGFQVPQVAEFAPSWSFPEIEGNQVKTGGRDGAAGLYSHLLTWEVDVATRTVTQVNHEEAMRVRVESVSATGLTGRFLTPGYDDHIEAFSLVPGFQVTQAGKPVSPESVKVGKVVYLRTNDWKVFEIQVE
jgi:hypothetical protein